MEILKGFVYFNSLFIPCSDPVMEAYALDFVANKFLLDGKLLGCEKNSVEIVGNKICIDGVSTKFGNESRFFNKGDVFGIGIYHLNLIMGCFATFNGKLLGKIIKKYFKFNNEK